MSSIYQSYPGEVSQDSTKHVGAWSEDPDVKPAADITIAANPVVTSYPRCLITRQVEIEFEIYL